MYAVAGAMDFCLCVDVGAHGASRADSVCLTSPSASLSLDISMYVESVTPPGSGSALMFAGTGVWRYSVPHALVRAVARLAGDARYRPFRALGSVRISARLGGLPFAVCCPLVAVTESMTSAALTIRER